MKLIFVTGNESKLAEARQILLDHEVINRRIDLPELQGERDEVVLEKARLAADAVGEACFVDDTSLCFSALEDLPGVYIKHFISKLGRRGLIKLLEPYEDKGAKAVSMIGFCRPGEDPICFEGLTEGIIVDAPRGDRFGWDPIFQPENFIFQPGGTKLTYAEMTAEQKNEISHRRKALEALKEYLEDDNC